MKQLGPGLHLRLLLARAGQPDAGAGDRRRRWSYIQQDAGAGHPAAGGHRLAGVERLGGRGQHLEDPAARVREAAAAGQGLHRRRFPRANSAARCCCWTTGTSGARATTSRPIASTASAIWTPCARSSPTRPEQHVDLIPRGHRHGALRHGLHGVRRSEQEQLQRACGQEGHARRARTSRAWSPGGPSTRSRASPVALDYSGHRLGRQPAQSRQGEGHRRQRAGLRRRVRRDTQQRAALAGQRDDARVLGEDRRWPTRATTGS